MTQSQVAKAIGVPAHLYISWESGTTPSTRELQCKVAVFYGVPVDELYPEEIFISRCKWCGKSLEGTRRRSFCSDKCYALAERDRIHQERIENKLTCVWCGKKLPLGRHKYCSEECTQSANNIRKRKQKIETYDPASGESYAEYQMRRNPKYYKSIYIAPKRKGVGE